MFWALLNLRHSLSSHSWLSKWCHLEVPTLVLGASQAVKSGEVDWEMTGKSPIGVGEGKATVMGGNIYKFTSILLINAIQLSVPNQGLGG